MRSNMEKALVKSEFDRDMDETVNMVMQVMMMAMMLFFLIPMLPVAQAAQRYYDSQQFIGESESKILHATQYPQHIVIDHPWVGAYIVNNGPDIAYLKINSDASTQYPLGVYETLTFDRLGAQNRIYAIYYQCDGGKTAEIEVIGQY